MIKFLNLVSCVCAALIVALCGAAIWMASGAGRVPASSGGGGGVEVVPPVHIVVGHVVCGAGRSCSLSR